VAFFAMDAYKPALLDFFVRWVCDLHRTSGLSRTAVEMADIDIIAFCAKHNGLFLEIASMLFW
jgi:hypothetical protein